MGHGRDTALQTASVSALRARLNRVKNLEFRSALDEFLGQKIPLQMGGMSDPFMPIEVQKRASFGLATVLRDFDHPYLVSTKSDLCGTNEYVSLFGESRAMVRFSMTGISDALRSEMDKGTPARARLLKAIESLSQRGVPTAVRIQPIFPGHEETAGRIIDEASAAGAKHVSLEYLKLPLEADREFSNEVSIALGGRPIEVYRMLGALRRGREYTLPSSYRIPHLLDLRKRARRLGMTVGLADNDLLHLGDGKSCCNGIDLHVPNISIFQANLTGVLKSTAPGQLVRFEDVTAFWSPTRDISPYLNSTARLPKNEEGHPSWMDYMRRIWSGQHRSQSPENYLGIVRHSDGEGHHFERVKTPFD